MRSIVVACVGLMGLFLNTASHADEPRCVRASAIPASVQGILDNPDAFIGKCVRIRGLLAYRSLFPDVEALYHMRNASAYSSQLAVYAASGHADEHLWIDRSLVEFVGNVTTCSLMWDQAMKEADKLEKESNGRDTVVPFMSGVCHYTDIPAIVVFERVNLDGPVRLTGNQARQQYGDLDRIRDESANMASTRQIAEKWFDAVRRGDGEAAVPGNEDWKTTRRTELLDKQKSPARFLIGAASVPDIVYFRDVAWRKIPRAERVAHACVCKTESCSGEWPIAGIDTENSAADWPYYCIEIGADGQVEYE